jgi:chromosome segregation protein
MQMTRLRLVGFKSFVEPANLLIEPGLTGVVGPNGCGKSPTANPNFINRPAHGT